VSSLPRSHRREAISASRAWLRLEKGPELLSAAGTSSRQCAQRPGLATESAPSESRSWSRTSVRLSRTPRFSRASPHPRPERNRALSPHPGQRQRRKTAGEVSPIRRASSCPGLALVGDGAGAGFSFGRAAEVVVCRVGRNAESSSYTRRESGRNIQVDNLAVAHGSRYFTGRAGVA